MPDGTETRNAALGGADLLGKMGFGKVVAEDYRTHNRDITVPGFQALLAYRLGTWAKTLPRPFRWPVSLLYMLGFLFARGVYGIELRRTAKIGRRFHIGHQHGIVIHKFASFGNDCTVRQGVTFGISNEERWQRGVGPVIGNNVSFSPGCIVIGNVKIGDNVQIGPNCVVTSDVPSNRILFVPPPRVLPRQTADEGTGTETQTENEDRN